MRSCNYLPPGRACIIVILLYFFYFSFLRGSEAGGVRDRLAHIADKSPTSCLDTEHSALSHSSARKSKLAIMTFNTKETSYTVLSLKNKQRKFTHTAAALFSDV